LPKEETGNAALYAYRSGGLPSLRSIGIGGLTTRYEGYVEGTSSTSGRPLTISFEYPTDWLQLDKLGGGIQYVDQRNGNKLYVLRAPLPADTTTLSSVPKSFFDESLFDPRGDIVRVGSGVTVEPHRTTRSQMSINDAEGGGLATPRRRLLIKYDTITGSGVQTVEQRGLLDVYKIGGYAYMMLASCNAVKFEQGGRERETMESIVDSFRVG